MKKIHYILLLMLTLLFEACQKEVIIPNNPSKQESVSNQVNSTKSMTITSDGIVVIEEDENSIVDPTGRPKPSRPGSGGSK
jgi:hypothetical protein